MDLNFIKDTIEDKWDDSMGCGGLILIILFVLAIVLAFVACVGGLSGFFGEQLWSRPLVYLHLLSGKWQDLTFSSVCSFLILQALLKVKTEVN